MTEITGGCDQDGWGFRLPIEKNQSVKRVLKGVIVVGCVALTA
jgi:hypothetical protein